MTPDQIIVGPNAQQILREAVRLDIIKAYPTRAAISHLFNLGYRGHELNLRWRNKLMPILQEPAGNT